ncbi:MAG TPA: PadR family transcriptional regulator [Caproiciproducens sp.]|nr:PadR family transcriptional regulator [Caproiciproducens sp.]
MSRINNSYYAILGILGFGSMSGYGIKSWVNEGVGYFWEIDYKQIYPTLRKLVDLNLAVYKTEKNGNRPESKVYTITEEGLDELKKWLLTPIAPGKNSKSELLLKLFFGHHVPLEVNLQHIKRFKEETIQRLETLKEIAKKMNECPAKDADWHYRRTTVLKGEIQYRADIEWCDQATDYLVNQRNFI